MGRSKGHRRAFFRRIMAFSMLIAGLCAICIFACAKFMVEPNLEKVAGIRAEAVVSRTINKALAAQFQEGSTGYDLFTISKSSDGTMEMVQANSPEINILMSELSVKLQESFQNMEREGYEVPVGSLLGSKVFSQMGPSVEVTVIPMSISSMDFRTEFESQGINQTKYKIYIDMECRIRVLAPFSSNTFNTSNTILVAEAVILGDVPNSYVEVPKEDILDVIDE